jgi:hypothetical protein
MLKKYLPSLWSFHKHSPCAVAALLHYRLKWHKPNISNTPPEESPSDWGLVSMRAMEWAHLNLSTFHQNLNVDVVEHDWGNEPEPQCAWTTCDFVFIEVHRPWAVVENLRKNYGMPLLWVSLANNVSPPLYCPHINWKSLLMSQLQNSMGVPVCPHVSIVKVSNVISCTSCFISKQNVR